jgi:RNA polymerase sigma-70 factor (ECF subfamily)
MRRFAYAMTGSIAEGDDLVQATYERAIRHLDQWQRGTRLDSWMYRIAQNLYRNELRSRRRQRDYGEEVSVHQPTRHDGLRAQEARLTLKGVRERMDELPAEQRSVLVMVCIEGLSYKETAAALEVPIGTVTSRLARARAALLEGLVEDVPGSGDDE